MFTSIISINETRGTHSDNYTSQTMTAFGNNRIPTIYIGDRNEFSFCAFAMFALGDLHVAFAGWSWLCNVNNNYLLVKGMGILIQITDMRDRISVYK